MPAIGAKTAIPTGNSTARNLLPWLPLLIANEFVPRFPQHLPQCMRILAHCKMNHSNILTPAIFLSMVLEGGKQPDV
jgi:hypothetical protein